MDKKIPTRRYQLDVTHLKTLEDVIKILDALDIRIDSDNPRFEELKPYFTTEVVPRGYIPLKDTMGWEAMEHMTYEEMEQKIKELKLLENEETD